MLGTEYENEVADARAKIKRLPVEEAESILKKMGLISAKNEKDKKQKEFLNTPIKKELSLEQKKALENAENFRSIFR